MILLDSRPVNGACAGSSVRLQRPDSLQNRLHEDKCIANHEHILIHFCGLGILVQDTSSSEQLAIQYRYRAGVATDRATEAIR